MPTDQQSLSEDAADLAVFEARARETALPFEDVLKDLKRRGKLGCRARQVQAPVRRPILRTWKGSSPPGAQELLGQVGYGPILRNQAIVESRRHHVTPNEARPGGRKPLKGTRVSGAYSALPGDSALCSARISTFLAHRGACRARRSSP